LVQQWGVVPDLLEPADFRFAMRGEKKYGQQRRRLSPPGKPALWLVHESAFDGELVYRKSHGTGGQVEKLGHTHPRWTRTPVFTPGNHYLKSAGFHLPNTGATMHQPV